MAIKVGKQDVRSAMRDIFKDEMGKQQKAELEKTMESLYKESYSDFCNYCKQITTVDGSKETTKLVEIDGKKYLTAPCRSCKKDLYVRIIMEAPKSLLDSPSSRGYFFTKEYVYKLPEEPEKQETTQRFSGSVWKKPEQTQ